MFCCESSFSLGCFTHCACIDLGIEATQDGDYIFEYTYGIPGTVHSQTLTNVVAGQSLYLPFSVNEYSLFFLKIKQPDGTYYTIAPYDCFTVTVTPRLNHGISEYGSGCNTPAGDLNTQATLTGNFLSDYLPDESGNSYKTIQITSLDHSSADLVGYLVKIGGQNINVGNSGKFTVNLPAGMYSMVFTPLSNFGVFGSYTQSVTIL